MTQLTLTSLRLLTGISCPLTTLMVMPGPETITECGEKLGLTMVEFLDAR